MNFDSFCEHGYVKGGCATCTQGEIKSLQDERDTLLKTKQSLQYQLDVLREWENIAHELYSSLSRYSQTDSWVDEALTRYRDMQNKPIPPTQEKK